MGINIRAKGQNGEREFADMLEAVIRKVRARLGLPPLEKDQVQRNQNQSAVGGCDLTGTYCFAIEVKRQEQLAINTWWAQCLASAKELGGIPVLAFRQNAQPGKRTKWRIMMHADLDHTIAHLVHSARVEVAVEDFLALFEAVCEKNLLLDNPGIEEHPARQSLFGT
jgi:hypothetical protein